MAYDKTEIYAKDIAPLVKQILLLCDQNKIPVFITLALRDDGKETTWYSEMISSMNADRKLSNDYLPKIVNVLNGFDLVPYLDQKAIDMEVHTEPDDSGEKTSINETILDSFTSEQYFQNQDHP